MTVKQIKEKYLISQKKMWPLYPSSPPEIKLFTAFIIYMYIYLFIIKIIL